jgi:Protein of unknown function (DUF2442)
MILSIQNVKSIGDFKLQIHFNDGSHKVIDFESFLNQSHHPAIRVFLQHDRFNNYRIEHGDLVWGDYDLCFPIADLYYDRIDHALTA